MFDFEAFWNRYYDLMPYVALTCLVGAFPSTLHDIYFRRGNDRIAIAGILNLFVGALLFFIFVLGQAFQHAGWDIRGIIWVLGTFAIIYLKKALLVHFKIVKGQEARRARNGVFIFWLLPAVLALVFVIFYMK
jgi:hypothetical protein